MSNDALIARASSASCKSYVQLLLNQDNAAQAESYISKATSLIAEAVAMSASIELEKPVRQAIANRDLTLAQILIAEAKETRWINMSIRGFSARIGNLPPALKSEAAKKLDDLFPLNQCKAKFEMAAFALDDYLCSKACY